MERRRFLKLTFGFVAGATALAASVQAAPLPPIAAEQGLVPPQRDGAEPAVVSQDEVDRLKPEEVRWGHHGHHHHWHRRHRGWHRRHWGWRHHHWGHHHWHRHRW
jgi:hypothetical protein